MNTLQDHFLIAMPALGDPNFSGTVTYLCQHSDDGAVGIVINKPLEIHVADENQEDQHVLSGGPVQPDRGFVLHRSSTDFESTFDSTSSEIKVTVSKDILTSMAQGRGPEPALVALGYAGWTAGQLESELAANAWLSVPADPAIVFDTPFRNRWAASAALLGVDLKQLTRYSGNA